MNKLDLSMLDNRPHRGFQGRDAAGFEELDAQKDSFPVPRVLDVSASGSLDEAVAAPKLHHLCTRITSFLAFTVRPYARPL